MRIKLTNYLLHEGNCYTPDDVFDVPDKLATRLIEDGHAVAFVETVEPKSPAKPKKKAVS